VFHELCGHFIGIRDFRVTFEKGLGGFGERFHGQTGCRLFLLELEFTTGDLDHGVGYFILG